MSRTKILLPLLLVAIGAGIAEGQFSRTHRPIQRLDRWLGVGNGPGYHWQTPGPDSGYYNPWSTNNSSLVSRHSNAPPGYPEFDDSRSVTFVPNDHLSQYPHPFDFVPEPPVLPGNGNESGNWNSDGGSGSSSHSNQASALRRTGQLVPTLPTTPAIPAPGIPTSVVWPYQTPLTLGDE